jgi:hypothetical protein
MSRFIDETGNTHGLWSVLEYRGRKYWLCRCACGREAEVTGDNLRSKKSRSCHSCALTTHGMSKTSPIYSTWEHIIQRTENPNNDSFHNYGGRGIHLYPPWRNDFAAFEKYIADELGPRKRGRTLDRIDNDAGYVPGNLRWATKTEQQQNRRKATHCPNGHLYNDANLHVWRNRRICRICRDERTAKYLSKVN